MKIKKKRKKSLDLINFVEKSIRQKNLFKPNQALLLTVSGGQDSICLLLIFFQLKNQWNWKLKILYCNHLWQKDSFYSLFHLFKVTFFLKIPFCFGITLEKIFSEQKARNWRFFLFERVNGFYNYHYILTGHSASDRIETGFFKIFKGSSPKGISFFDWTKSFSIQKNYKPNKKEIVFGDGTRKKLLYEARPFIENKNNKLNIKKKFLITDLTCKYKKNNTDRKYIINFKKSEFKNKGNDRNEFLILSKRKLRQNYLFLKTLLESLFFTNKRIIKKIGFPISPVTQGKEFNFAKLIGKSFLYLEQLSTNKKSLKQKLKRKTLYTNRRLVKSGSRNSRANFISPNFKIFYKKTFNLKFRLNLIFLYKEKFLFSEQNSTGFSYKISLSTLSHEKQKQKNLRLFVQNLNSTFLKYEFLSHSKVGIKLPFTRKKNNQISFYSLSINNYFYNSNFLIARPLFALTRFDIKKLCNLWELPLYPDHSNQSLNFCRNRIRNQILPSLRIFFNPQIDYTFYRFIDIMNEEQKHLDFLAIRLIESILKDNTFVVTLETSLFKNLPKPIKRRTLKLFLEFFISKRINFIHVEKLLQLVEQNVQIKSLKVD